MIGDYTNNQIFSHFDSFHYENSYEEKREEEEKRLQELADLQNAQSGKRKQRLVKFLSHSRHVLKKTLSITNFIHTGKKETFISRMPMELLVHIVGFLEYSDIWNVMLVCKEWRAIAQDEFLWKIIYQNYFVYYPNREAFAHQRKTQKDLHWRDIFRYDYIKETKWSSDVYKESYLHGHTGTVWTMLYDDENGLIYTGSFDKTTKVWDLKKRKCLYTLYGHSYPVQCLDVDNGFMVTGSLDNSLRLWDLGKRQCHSIVSTKAHNFDVFCLQMSGGLIASGSSDSTVKLWRVDDLINSEESLNDRMDRGEPQVNMQPLQTFKHNSCVTCLQMTGDRLMSGGSDKVVRVWDLNAQKESNVLVGHDEGIRCLQFNENILVTGSNDTTVKLWDLRIKHGAYSSLRTQGSIRCLQWEGTSLITGSNDQVVRWWNLNTGASVELFQSESSVSCLKFKDNMLMCGLSDSKIQILKFV
ncbi:WD40 repeat-containing protein [Heterostelium album PN500]|uniref:WD40 repeat-containing protein n=1 Tax=Heterostelium pallidum (strain ATCC 26659 / Pp 5 / PN500) TaxID=670386 RepID=D3BTM6_HETP5|nr:WD40 repeat-containing protein [Heterostelium album PN500]EFA75443.1 WD40 repeat-containing protein [Heterostelium album PN500]|eukprot:XP_020427577.1 WD40 repeat-containing protein [Heterostelium album PN500]